MQSKKSFIGILLGIILSSSCRNDIDENLISLYRQRIDGSKYVLYDYDYEGNFVFTGNFHGLAILDSTIRFSRNEIVISGEKTNRLPWNIFESTPRKKAFRMVDIVQNSYNPGDTSLIPIRSYSKTYNNNSFTVTEYHITYGAGSSSSDFNFDSLRETKDSVIFYNLKCIYCRYKLSSTASFVKGNIKIIDTGDFKLDHIEIQQPFIGRGSIYKPSDPLKLVPNQPIVEIVTYSFYPSKPLSSTPLSDYGIFKQIK
jgi:hypothetical protein